jgi:class 3 adenylate cyclase
VEGLRLIVTASGEAYQARVEGALLASSGDQPTAMTRAAQLGVAFEPLADPMLLAIYHRQQELAWTEGLVERIEGELEAAGVPGRRPGRVPAMVFLDLTGYTRLTEQRGDQAAAGLAETLALLVGRSAREHGGVPVKWLGDGVMVWFREPAGAVGSALELVAQVPVAGLPPAHVGVAAGPVVIQGGDYFGRTVNLAARIASRAGPGQVLVSDRVAEQGQPAPTTTHDPTIRSEPSAWTGSGSSAAATWSRSSGSMSSITNGHRPHTWLGCPWSTRPGCGRWSCPARNGRHWTGACAPPTGSPRPPPPTSGAAKTWSVNSRR